MLNKFHLFKYHKQDVIAMFGNFFQKSVFRIKKWSAPQKTHVITFWCRQGQSPTKWSGKNASWSLTSWINIDPRYHWEHYAAFLSGDTNPLLSIIRLSIFPLQVPTGTQILVELSRDSTAGLSTTATVAPTTSVKLHWTVLLVFFLSFLLSSCVLHL